MLNVFLFRVKRLLTNLRKLELDQHYFEAIIINTQTQLFNTFPHQKLIPH